ncbi:porin family protein [Chitinophaga niabensis]|uniref:Outer membrane protein beta-barrel domain-containing protein n=1 Tax=Chitinophaga niabensis TaxID=536979 RepID=A0A1N6D5S2_9BACT|nr:porin family protein [Chitinophaga niabensis]SIN66125.1 Outer membrane protein beta-barrel domain-containing protein [Chitinophaga niabensis]
MKIIFSLLLTVCTLPVYAQVSIGVIGGYSHATLKATDRQETYTTDIFPPPAPVSKYAPKWHAGLVADIHLVKGLYLQPQVLISKKGAKMEQRANTSFIIYRGDLKTELTYLELPLNLVYKMPLGPGKLVAGAGGYCARGLSGKFDDRVTQTTLPGGTPNKNEIRGKIYFEDKIPAAHEPTYYYKKSDHGLNFMAGYEFKNGLIFNASYSLGLTDAFTPEPEIRKNRYFGLSAGYLLKVR